ncbi:MAG: M61 family peptidase [Steroidobacterales bacterium]
MNRRRMHASTLLLAAWMGFAARASDITLRVDAHDVARNRIHTDQTLSVRPGPLTLAYAKWIPGEHGPNGPLDSIIGLEIRANGAPLAWTRDPLDVYSLRVTVPRGVDHLDVTIETGLPTEGVMYTSGQTNSARLAILSWNEFVLFPKGVDADKLSVEASLVAPDGWTIVCALDGRPATGGATRFEKSTLARLIDSPAQIGRYARRIELKGSAPAPELRHALSIMADSEAALETPEDLPKGYDRLVSESGALFGSRMYRHYTWLVSLSNHIAHFGLEHHESSDDRAAEGMLGAPDLRMELAGLLGHEYVHSWNGKYRRPLGLLSPDFQQPMDGSLLWVYEGMANFLGFVLPTRAGLITPEYYREKLAASASALELEVGARWRPLADTVAVAQLRRSAVWQSSRRSTDYYAASDYLWLDVDAELRARSQGRVTLDDFVRRFCAGTSGAPQVKPYVEQDIYDTLAALAPGDWRSFVRRHLDQTGTMALFGALDRTGWKLGYTVEHNAALTTDDRRRQTTNRLASVGFTLDWDNRIVDVIDDRAAARAGAGPGMRIVAVNGQRFTMAVLDDALALAQKTRQPIALLVEKSDYFQTLMVEYYDGPRYPHLVRIEGRKDNLQAILAPRTPN